MTASNPIQPSTPWWREPWPWFLMALPMSAVIAGLVTAWIAFKDPDPLVSEDYYKEGMTIYQVLEREARARELGLTARMTMRDDTLEVTLDGRLDTRPTRLQLDIAHPTRAAQDATVILHANAEGRYQGNLPAITTPGKRRIRIEPEDRAWRLSGQWEAPFAGELQLQPAP